MNMDIAQNANELRGDLENILIGMRKTIAEMLEDKDTFLLNLKRFKEGAKVLADMERAHKRLRKVPKTPKPRCRVTQLAPGHCLTTVPGSLYHSILVAMARLGGLHTHEALFGKYSRLKLSAHDLIALMKVSDAHVRQFVQADPEFVAHAQKMTARLHEKAGLVAHALPVDAAANAKAKKVLANPKICQDGQWHGDFEEAFGVLKQGNTKKNTRNRRNCAILAEAHLLFDVVRDGEQRFFVLYPEEWEKVFKDAVSTLPA